MQMVLYNIVFLAETFSTKLCFYAILFNNTIPRRTTIVSFLSSSGEGSGSLVGPPRRIDTVAIRSTELILSSRAGWKSISIWHPLPSIYCCRFVLVGVGGGQGLRLIRLGMALLTKGRDHLL